MNMPDTTMVSLAWRSGHSRESTIFNLEDFETLISMLPWGQKTGVAGPFDETGQEYFELKEVAYARPNDVGQITGVVLRRAFARVLEHVEKVQQYPLRGSNGVIHWRKRPEFEAEPCPLITEYRADGPDFDHTTLRHCVKDHDWVLVKVYARFSFVHGAAQ